MSDSLDSAMDSEDMEEQTEEQVGLGGAGRGWAGLAVFVAWMWGREWLCSEGWAAAAGTSLAAEEGVVRTTPGMHVRGCACMQIDKILLEVAGETLSQMAAAPKQQKQVSHAAWRRRLGDGPGGARFGASTAPEGSDWMWLLPTLTAPLLLSRWSSREWRRQQRRAAKWRTCKRGWQQFEAEPASLFLYSSHMLPLSLLNYARCFLPLITACTHYAAAAAAHYSCPLPSPPCVLLHRPHPPMCAATRAVELPGGVRQEGRYKSQAPGRETWGAISEGMVQCKGNWSRGYAKGG